MQKEKSDIPAEPEDHQITGSSDAKMFLFRFSYRLRVNCSVFVLMCSFCFFLPGIASVHLQHFTVKDHLNLCKIMKTKTKRNNTKKQPFNSSQIDGWQQDQKQFI